MILIQQEVQCHVNYNSNKPFKFGVRNEVKNIKSNSVGTLGQTLSCRGSSRTAVYRSRNSTLSTFT